jgi:hypothetical protein
MQWLIPHIASSDRATSVWASREFLYDSDNDLLYYGDGATLGGVSLATGAGGGGAVAISGTNGSFTYSTLTVGALNGVTFYTSNGSLVASYNSTQFQQSSLMTNYLGTTYTSHTHSQYLNTSQSSLFQQTSNTSNITSNALNTSQSSLFQQTSLMTDYLGTTYTSHTHSQYVNTSQSSLFQQTSLMSNYLGTTASINDLADVVVSSATLGQALVYNGANWINADLGTGVGAGNGVILYFDSTPSGISTYETIAPAPDTDPQADEVVTVNNSTLLIGGYANPVPIGRTTIDAGAWDFNIYTYVSNTTPSSTLVFEVYSRTSGGTETLLFSAESDPITFTAIQGMNFTSVQPAYSVNSTDYLVIKVYGKTTALVNIDVHFVHSGTTHYSHVHTPLAPLHNDLGGLQGGASNEYFHLNSNDYLNRNVSATSVYQLLANSSLSLGTSYTSHTHSQYLNTSQSSLFQQVSNTSAITSNALNTSQSSLFQHTSATSAITSNAVNTSAARLQGVIASNTTYTSGSFSLVDLNGITFQSTTGQGIQITHALQYTSNTSAITASALNTSQSSLFQQTSNTSAITSNALHTSLSTGFAGTGTTTAGTNISLSMTLNSLGLNLAASVNPPGAGGGGVALADAANTYSSGTVFFSNSNNVTFGFNASTITASASFSQSVQPVAVSGTNGSFTFSTLSFANINNYTFYTTNGSIAVSQQAAAPRSFYNPYGDLVMVAGQAGQGTLQLNPNIFPDITFDRILMPINNTNSSNSSGSHTLSFWIGIYTMNVSTLSLLTSNSVSYALTHSGTVGSYSLYSGMRHVSMPMSTSLSEGRYFIGILSRTTSGGANGSYSQMLVSNLNSNFLGFFGSSHNTTMQFQPGLGVYSATTSGMPNAISISQVRGSDSAGFRPPVLVFANSTL